MCICLKWSSRYNRWWTGWFHVHCFACVLILLGLLFFGRLIFDDLDKHQFIHLGIHALIVSCLLTLLVANRCSIPRLYFVYFIAYHLALLANIGLEIYDFYTTPRPSASPTLLVVSDTNFTTLSTPATTTSSPLVTRFPNGQESPFVTMKEEALYALIIVCLVCQTYATLVITYSYFYLIDKQNSKVHPLEGVVVTGNDAGENKPDNNGARNPPEKERSKWEEALHSLGIIASCIVRFVPNK